MKKKEPNIESRIPIDEDKITETPHNLPYAHNVGSAIIFPDDKDRIKSHAMSAMVEQTNVQMKQIYDQMELLVNQANDLKERVEISELIYSAEISFKPITGHVYHLYEKENGVEILSIVGPKEWKRESGYKRFVASVKLMGDHTWEILEKGEK